MRRMLTSRYHPIVLQVLMTAILAAVIYFLFAYPPSDEYNPGSYLLWYVWWAALPLTFLVLGRLWCSVCPIGLLSDTVQKAVPWNLDWPAQAAGFEIGILSATFLLVHFTNLYYNFEENVAPGLVFLLAIIGLSLLAALVFRKRVWCRALCPLGAMAGLISSISFLRIKSNAALCRTQCSGKICTEGFGKEGGCPVLEQPRKGIDTRFCNYCGECLKVCPHDSCDVYFNRLPQSLAPAGQYDHQSFFASMLLLGVSLDMGLKHINDWPILFWQYSAALGVDPSAYLEMGVHMLVCFLPAAVFSLAVPAFVRRNTRPALYRLAHAGLGLSAMIIIAMGTRPLLVNGPQNLKGILLSAGLTHVRWLDATRHLDGWPIRIIQLCLIFAGVIMTLRAAIRLDAGKEQDGTRLAEMVAGAVIYLLFGAAAVWIFFQPMLT